MTHLLSNSVDFNNVIGTLFDSNFPKDAFDKLEAQLRAEGLLGENEALTYGNAASILPQVALGTLTVNPDGSYSFTLSPDGSAGRHDREHVRRGLLLQPEHQLLRHRPARRRFQRFIRRHHQGHQRPARTGTGLGGDDHRLVISTVRRPTETRRPTPQSP